MTSLSTTGEGPLRKSSVSDGYLGLNTNAEGPVTSLNTSGEDSDPTATLYLDVSSDVDDSGNMNSIDLFGADDKHYEDAREATDSFSRKRLLSTSSSSDMPERKRGKVVQRRFDTLF